ncbi:MULTISPECIES: 3'-5' exonuclease [unclassified Alcanivorax]|uniref:3'-5' exonuclease n=1 Tax=unclassified Alcanivorax TaxID=2638842 RepID=UPI0009DE4360|nr:exonuclease [Alcanivorax sp. 97CO-6]
MSRPILIVDLEATCWRDKHTAPAEKEVIEIGCALVASDSTVMDDFSTFVKPLLHPNLTAFCTELTTITQSDVDTAPSYPEACQLVDEWLGQRVRGSIWGSWGNYDRNQLLEEKARHCAAPAFLGVPHINLKRLWARSLGIPPRGMARALAYSDIQPEGTHHRGIDDVRNIAKLLPGISRQLINHAVATWAPYPEPGERT